jgi:hypothetical protein
MADERGSDAAGYLGWFFLGAVAGAAADTKPQAAMSSIANA